MPKIKIFIGSSSEALPYARKIAELLSELEGIETILWNKVFQPSFLTLEAIEKLLEDISGAVLIASPDDRSEIRGNNVILPRANVIFELGLLSSRLGRENVALCKFDDVTLPTDLNGFANLPMGIYAKNTSDPELRGIAQTSLISWARSRTHILSGNPLTQILNGISGRWNFNIRFKKWRNRLLASDELAIVQGYLDITVPWPEHPGVGMAHGDLRINIKNESGDWYNANIAVSDTVKAIRTFKDGGFRFTSQTFSRMIEREEGDAGPQEGIRPILKGVTTFEWSLHPDPNKPDHLVGIYSPIEDDSDDGKLIAWRD